MAGRQHYLFSWISSWIPHCAFLLVHVYFQWSIMVLHCKIYVLVAVTNKSSLALNGGGHIFSLPVLALIFPACSLVLSHLLRDSLCKALRTERLWIWSTGLSMQLTLSSHREAWVLGNLTALTERSQPAIRWTRGRGGESYVLWLFPWRTLKISTYSEPW